MMGLSKRRLLAIAVAAVTGNVWAGATVNFGEAKSVSVGFGLRESYTSAENAAPDGGRSNDFNLDSGRLYFGASLNKNIKGMFNTEWDGDKIRVLDAAGQFAISPELNIWAGRLLSPSDRANMAGPYYSLGGGYWAGVASRYGYNGGIFRGRDDGVVVWGNVGDGGRLGYSFGAFEGHTFGIGSLTQSQAKAAGIKADDSLMYAGRVQYDFWDAEPGYYGTGNYLGQADILAIGVAGRYQKDGILTVGAVGKYSSYNVDFLLEKRIKGAGAFALEAAWYDYNTDDIVKSEQGKAYSAGASYIFEDKAGWGRFQPFVRAQKFAADTNIDTKQYDVGVNYIIEGYNAQVSAVYSKTRITSVADQDKFQIALQLQY
ncbi:porin [Duganella callida]|uniref:Porin n=1 Tax=Duganella callida TaxID=2561932 RepID=A0A4Y9SIA7_9BURK|nr:porin [Duganella callida]TFW20459.1 porin [Duganella callida]